MAIIAHLDMDAFFASVEERDKPWLKGLPIVVGADPKGGEGRGVVSTANYKAREYGIHSALPIQVAWKYSEEARKRGEPAAAFIAPRGHKYGEASREVMEIVRDYTKAIQQTSVDEAYMNFSHYRSFTRAKETAEVLKRDIKRKTKLTCSIGIGPNRMLAKIASDFEKPGGLTIVRPRDIRAFLDPLPVRSIPGVGPKAEQKLKKQGVITIWQLKQIPWQEMERLFGKWGFDLYEKAQGIASIDVREESDSERKSIGEHETFEVDTLDFDFISNVLARMAHDIVETLLRKGFTGFRTVVLTVRFADFETKTRSLTTPEPTKSARVLEQRGIKLLLPFLEKRENPKQKLIRLVGLRIEKLV